MLSCLGLSKAAAQEAPELPVPWQVGTPYPAPVAAPLPAPPRVDPLFAAGPNQRIELDVLIGLPTAVRLQGAVFGPPNCSFMLEGVAGLEFILPLVGAGARLRFAPCRGECNALVIKPGINGYYLVNIYRDWWGGSPSTFLLGADVEIVWFHNFGRCGSELGLDLGVLGGKRYDGDGHLNNWGLPIVSFIIGFRF
jgi:hypothetical protein